MVYNIGAKGAGEGDTRPKEFRSAPMTSTLVMHAKRIKQVPGKVAWTPLIQSADELIEGETTSKSEPGRSVKFHDGILELHGPGASFRPKFSAKNYIVRAQALFLDSAVLFYVRRQPGSDRKSVV